MKTRQTKSKAIAAAKAGMSNRTADKYLQQKKLPSEIAAKRTYRTRRDPFESDWPQIDAMLNAAPELQAQTVLTHLMEQYPERYEQKHLRSLQRRLRDVQALLGPAQPVMFRQVLVPARQSQSDWTHMGDLLITLAYQPFAHLLFHFMLPYSGWEAVSISHSESFDSLSLGYEKAVWELGGVLPEHRTDNLSAATQRFGDSRQFTERWKAYLKHYGVIPSRNNPGESHENGSVEKSHDTFKNAVNQHLLLRGSRNFNTQADYEAFLAHIQHRRNQARRTRVEQELMLIKALPERKWNDPQLLRVRVSSSSTVQLLGIAYSVPSRLISYVLRAQVYPHEIQLWYGEKWIQTMPRVMAGCGIDYRHIIDSLLRKPAAFFNYQYKDALFPQVLFRKAFDALMEAYPQGGHKHYLKLLQLAKVFGEADVMSAMELCFEQEKIPLADDIKPLLDARPARVDDVFVQPVTLADYDSLHQFN